MIACYVDKNQTNWDEQLPFLAFAYNTAEQASLGRTPFEIIYGRLAKVPIDLTYQNKDFDQFRSEWLRGNGQKQTTKRIRTR